MSSLTPSLGPRISTPTQVLEIYLCVSVLHGELPNEFLLPFANMQITVQMLDGSITPFKVRSSITIASFKNKFEPWQPMKGRALLHHDVRLDDRATLGSIAGVKNGTVLRVDKHVSQVKNRTRKKTVMSGPASSAVDEDVMDSIETSGEGEQTSSEDEGQISSSKRKRPSRTLAAAVARSLRARSPLPGDMSDDRLNTIDTTLSSSSMALRTVKKEKRDSAAHEQGAPSEARTLDQRLHSPKAPAGAPTASAYFAQDTDLISSHQSIAGDNDTTFLSGINAAAAVDETDRQSPSPESRPKETVSARQCTTCGRACGCATTPLLPSNDQVPPPTETIQRRGSTCTNNDTVNGHLIALGRNAASRGSQEPSWTGMW